VAKASVVVMVLTAGEQADGPARVAVHNVRIRATEIAQEAEALRAACRNPAVGVPVSDRLWDALIAPVEKELAGKNHVVIVPFGPLLALPFQALKKADGPYLLQRYTISYAPSVSALVEMVRRADRRRAEQPGAKEALELLAVGRPQFSHDLKDLPASAAEVEAIGQRFGDRGVVLTGERATRAAVLRIAAKARRLHFATHGLVNEERPLFSALALAPADSSDDGRLYASDLLPLSLSADLVVLSACETALGRQFRGEGMVGLAWAFFTAGAPSVVMSQWSVADASTSRLMDLFYQNLTAAKPCSRAEALRQAQLSLLKQRATRHPYFWAPFVLSGDWR
jgi:CHAT domain-containing protein